MDETFVGLATYGNLHDNCSFSDIKYLEAKSHPMHAVAAVGTGHARSQQHTSPIQGLGVYTCIEENA
jgi:hypothetical protein